MKHQLTIVGGQITPIFWGIKEKDPDIIHILYSMDSRYHLPIIKTIFPDKSFFTYQVNPFDFDEIKEKVEEIISKYPNDTFELNLTGGTKVMALACQNIFNKLSFNSFYINQRNKIFDFSTHKYYSINSKINLKTFINLSGHRKYTYNRLNEFSKLEIDFSKKINSISGNKLFKQSMKAVQTKSFNSKDSNFVKTCKKFDFSNGHTILNWNSPKFTLKNNEIEIKIDSKKAFEIAYNGFWWELVVADSIKNWKKIYELYLNVELYSKTKEKNIKNEIDIIINTGNKLIFIECKSGNVKQEDINKIRAVKKLYGGIASKSILVCKYKPRPDIIEKCYDLGISVFYDRNLNNLNNKLNNLITSMEL